MSPLSQLARNKAFGGSLTKYKFTSSSLGGLDTQLNVFLPEQASTSAPVPALVYLAGLTCNEDTGPWKSGILRAAGQKGLAVIFPDTSPRGAQIEGEDKDWDFGTGAGFYLDATAEPWKKHYNMYSLITSEIPSVLSSADLPIDFDRVSVIGHSMGGHGALTLYLKGLAKGSYKSASAFAPICNPSSCPWGQKAFSSYLSPSPSASWASYDALALLPSSSKKLAIKITYGLDDQFYKDGQLLPEAFEKGVEESGLEGVEVAGKEGYDHSYYFISSFIDEHVDFHAKVLLA